ncbi:hemicentin-1-like isoform X5 [Parambassis ranga]|uniref:Hemicentin-1-like isoform X5 n=1 Tax=Parambassis ranga TaxID=210632 RepID=A0A6P7K7J9_9TELE|nr:hemicentin-1-like isoform X5 [Parambassis ranga]
MALLLRACLCLFAVLVFVDGSETKLIVREDEDAILPCSLGAADISSRVFDWKKDGRVEVFIYDDGRYYGKGLSGQHEQFRGRVFHFPEQLKGGNASIVIRKSKPADSGTYACIFPHEQPERRAHVELIVGASPRPIITANETSDGMLLLCEVNSASPEPVLEWRNSSGNILPAEKPQVSEKNGSYSVVLQTTVTKSGRYRCVSTQQKIHHQVYTETHVNVHEGAAPKPVIAVKETKDGLLLQCEVYSASPKPEVVFRDSSGNILAAEPQVTERGGSYDVILETTVTKSGDYQCVATQKEINHQRSTETRVNVPSGAAPKPAIAVKETKDGLLLQCEVYGASPKPEVVFQDSSGNILAAEPQVTERGGSYDVILETTVTKSGDYQCVATQKEINHQISTEIHVNVPSGKKDKEELQQRKKHEEELQQELNEQKKKHEEDLRQVRLLLEEGKQQKEETA